MVKQHITKHYSVNLIATNTITGFCYITIRTGEPRWTELSHLFSKLVLAALFGAFIAFLIVQVINSPISTITLASPKARVQVPGKIKKKYFFSLKCKM